MLDSGAYSVMSKGITVDLEKYTAFAVQHQHGYKQIVNLDVISGDVTERVDQGKRNLQRMRDAGLDPLPVFHQGEPWSVLEELASCGKIGLGVQRPMRDVEDFLDGCFSRIPAGCYTHGFALAGVRYTKVYPFSSVDSATWFHEMIAAQALKGQGAEVLAYLTPAEILRLLVLKYQRMPKALAWAGPQKEVTFSDVFGLNG